MAPVVVLAALGLVSGCIADGKSRPVNQRATYIPKEQAEPSYYLKNPASADPVVLSDFDRLWATIYRVTRNAGFTPDRNDPRLGYFTTRPLVSSQWFEPWRGDTVTVYDRLDASIATVRRTVYWKVTRNPDGTFVALPKVLVERYSLIEHRVTSSAQYSEVFALTKDEAKQQQQRTLDPSSFIDEIAPTAYWYAVGRDEALEKDLASSVARRIRS